MCLFFESKSTKNKEYMIACAYIALSPDLLMWNTKVNNKVKPGVQLQVYQISPGLDPSNKHNITKTSVPLNKTFQVYIH